METKTKIHEAAIRSIMTYTAKTRHNSSKTRNMLETPQMRKLSRKKIVEGFAMGVECLSGL